MAANTRLLYCISICLLGAGLLDAGVNQAPTHLITEKGQKASFRCNPIKGHSYVFWYRQLLGEELKFLIYFQNEEKVDDSGMPNSRFSAQRDKNLNYKLEINSTELIDSAVYFCASSVSTVKQKCLLAELKPPVVPHRKHQGGKRRLMLIHSLGTETSLKLCGTWAGQEWEEAPQFSTLSNLVDHFGFDG